jgi:gliding motility-associated-like protein
MKKTLILFILGLFLTTNRSFAQQPTRGLVAHFDFEDTLRSTLVDISNNLSSGAFFGNPMRQGCGISGKSIRLDGVTNGIYFLGPISDAIRTGDFTLSIYFKPENTSNTQVQNLFTKGDSCNAERFFGVKVGVFQRNVFLEMRENKLTKNSKLKGLYGKACWHHLVLVKTKNNISMYLDDKTPQVIPISSAYNLTSASPLTLGISPCLGSDLVRFKGEIDELFMYNRSLSKEEVKQLYQPIDKILTRDTVVYLGRSTFQAFTTKTCADQFEWKPAATISNPAIQNPIITPTETTIYALTFKDNVSGCSTTDSVLVKVIDPDKVGCIEVLLPKAFTPNGDNLNEEYGISNPYAIEKLLSFEIYNRWGSRVFGTDDKFAKWNGEIGGKMGTTDTYIYKIEYECADKKQTISNTFTLMR